MTPPREPIEPRAEMRPAPCGEPTGGPAPPAARATSGIRAASQAEVGRGGRDEEGEEDETRAGVQLTHRDVEVLGWIADQHAVRTDVIRWMLGNGTPLSDSRTRAVVARWQRAGVAETRRFFVGTPHVASESSTRSGPRPMHTYPTAVREQPWSGHGGGYEHPHLSPSCRTCPS